MTETRIPTEQDLEQAISAAQERLDALLEEANGLGAREHAAQRAGDVDGVLAVRQRGDELPTELRHAKADVQDALADLEEFKANELRDDPARLARIERRAAEIKQLQDEQAQDQSDVDGKRRRRDQHTARQTEHRHEARRLRQEGIEWG